MGPKTLHFELGRRGPDAEFRDRVLRITALGKPCKGLCRGLSPSCFLVTCMSWVSTLLFAENVHFCLSSL